MSASVPCLIWVFKATQIRTERKEIRSHLSIEVRASHTEVRILTDCANPCPSYWFNLIPDSTSTLELTDVLPC